MNLKSPTFWMAIMLLISSDLTGQMKKHLSETKTMSGYNYRELRNTSGSENETLPLIIALHWMGSSPSDFSDYLTGFEKPVRVLLVEAPYPYKKGFSFYNIEPVNHYRLPDDQRIPAFEKEAEKLGQFIEVAIKKYKHSKKPVVIGASQGGDLSYISAIKYGDLLGLSCPLLATIEDPLVVKRTKRNKCRIIAFHCTDDPIVKIETARRHVQKLKQNKYKASLKEYEGFKHEIPEAMKNDYIQAISEYFWKKKK